VRLCDRDSAGSVQCNVVSVINMTLKAGEFLHLCYHLVSTSQILVFL